MKKLISLFIFMLLPLMARADAVEIDGIYYNLVTKTKQAEVVKNPSFYSGTIIIPETVSYNGVTYYVTSIGNQAFGYCDGLISILIPRSIISIGDQAFWNCRSLTTITIDEGLKTIGYQSFRGCSNINTFLIPSSVTSIGGQAFQECNGLTAVYITDIVAWCKISFGDPESNPLYYAHSLFLNSQEITILEIPDSVTSICKYAFYGYSSMTYLKFSNNVNSIAESAFQECSGLSSVIIPNSLNSISNGTFCGCHNLVEVKIPNSVSSIGEYAFGDCISLTNIQIPASVKKIGRNAFFRCNGLISLTIPNSVISINFEAFMNCSSLKSVTIGNGVTEIRSNAFGGCKELTDVICYAENVPETYHENPFENSFIEYATLHVPASSIETYRSSEPWKNFKTIVAIDGEAPEAKKCDMPIISYSNGKLLFSSTTDGAEFISDISDTDIKKNYTSEVSLTATYNISVYATKSGYDNSDVATATLCWIDVAPKTEGIEDGIAKVPAQAVLIQSSGNVVSVQGVDEGTPINVFDLSGQMVGSAHAVPGCTDINTSLRSGEVGIIKIGDKSVKVMIK